MERIDEVKQKLKSFLPSRRFDHSIRVAKQSVILARRFGADMYKAELAGVLHDCAKGLSFEESLKKAKDFGIILDNVTRNSPSIIHGLVGERLAEKEYNIGEREILDAIRYHTTGRWGMSLLEKIVFIADYTEPCRSFTGIGDVRKALDKNLDRAVLYALENTVVSLFEKGMLIHPDTIEARNYILQQSKAL